MCGGIVVATGTGIDPRLRLRMASQLPILLAQNSGRIFSYAIAGALAGGLGSLAAAFSLGGARSWLQGFSGLMMLGVGLFLAGVLPRFATIERVGLPCGLVYSALSIAVGAGSAKGGALTMLAFGLGTAPALLAMGAMATTIARAARKPFVRVGAGLVIAAFGVLHLHLASERLLAVPDAQGAAPTCCHSGHT
jgi:sulfite exporter TauE/SafE